MKQTNFIVSLNSDSGDTGIPQDNNSFTCPKDCPFDSDKAPCMARVAIGLLDQGFIIEGIGILGTLAPYCEMADNYLDLRLLDPSDEFPDETPSVIFAYGLVGLFYGADYKKGYDWIKDAADMGCTEAQELLKRLKKK